MPPSINESDLTSHLSCMQNVVTGQPFKGSWTNIRDIEVLPFSHRQTLSVFNGTLLGLGRVYLSDLDSDFCLQNSCTGKHNKDKHYLFSIELS